MPALQLVIEIDDKGAITKVKTLDGAFGKFTGGMGAKAATAAGAMKRISDATHQLQEGFKKAALAATAFFGIDAVIGIARKGIVGLTKDLFALVNQGAQINDMKETFARVRDQAGLLPGTLQEIRSATRGTVSDMDLMKSSTRALADELDPTRLIDFWAKARQISEANGTPIAQVFDMLYLAVAKGQTRMLTGIGITLDADEANQAYAASIGKTVAQLTHQENQIAVAMALEEKYARQFKSLGELGGDTAEKFAQFGAGVRNLKDKFLSMLASSPSVEKFLQMLIDKIGSVSSTMDTWEPKIKAVVEQLTKFYEGFINFASEQAGPAIANIWKYRDAIAAIAAVVGTGIIASKIMGIGVALGLVTGGAATAVTLLAAGFVGVAVAVDDATKETRDLDRAFQGFRPGMDFIPAMRQVKEETVGTMGILDELLAKLTAPGLLGLQLPKAPTASKGAGKAALAAVVAPQAIDWAAMGKQAEDAAQGTADMHLALFATVNDQLKADYLDTIASQGTADESWLQAKIALAGMERDAVTGNAAAIAEARIAYDNAVMEAELTHNEAVWQDWLSKNQGMLAMVWGLEAAWDTMVNSALDNEMTGKQRREAMWESMKQSFLRSTSDMLKKELILKVKNWVLADSARKPFVMREKYDAAKVGAVKAYAAFASIPIIGPMLGAIAAAAAFTFLMAFHKGGFIGNDERVIKVQTEEFVMQRSAVRNIGRENMEYMNSTGRIPTQSRGSVASGRVATSGGGSIGPFVFNVSAANKESANDLISFIEEKVVPMLESAVSRRKFSLEGEM